MDMVLVIFTCLHNSALKCEVKSVHRTSPQISANMICMHVCAIQPPTFGPEVHAYLHNAEPEKINYPQS